MKNKCTVIQINGLRGLFILVFIVVCAAVGFIVFPSWCCQHMWNYLSSYITGMPAIDLKEGGMLWLIIALILYLTMFGQFKVSMGDASEDLPDVAGLDGLNELNEMDIVNKIKSEIIEQVENEKVEK